MNEDVKQEQTQEKIVILFKEPGKKPEYRKIENSDEEFKRILGGEILKLDMVESYIVYLKDSEHLKANIYVRVGTNSLGVTIKGNLLLVAKNKDSNKIISLTREEAISYGTFLVQRAYDYSNQDENGKFLSKREMRQRELQKLKERKAEVQKCINDRLNNIPEKNENTNIKSKDEETSNLPPDNKNDSKEEFDENCIRLELTPDSDDTPDEKKNRIYLDAEIVNCLKAITFILSEIRIDIHNKL